MSDQFTIRPATRTSVKPLIGLYGKSGSGKTMSALLLARGIVGPSGRIVLVDSESGRGSIFSDLIPGGYSVLDLDAPFSPPRYEAAIAAAEARADVVVVDSMSHEWSGEGGVLDWADQELEKMGGGDNNKMRSWIKPKMAHKQMVMRLLRCKCALICCLRGEEKTHMAKGANGRNTVITDDFSTPLFDPRFIFELLLNFETLVGANGQGGYVIPRKITHPSIAPLLPGPEQQIGISTGEALAKWCASPGGAPANSPAKIATATTVKSVKSDLWKLTGYLHGGDKGKFLQWMIDEMLIAPETDLDTLTMDNWIAILKAAEKKVKPDIVP